MSFLSALAAPLLGAATSLFGGERANSASAKSVEKQIAFQRESLQNSHQWEVNDLRAAGLNPILSATHGPVGANGANYQAQNTGEAAVRGASAASQASIAKQSLELQREEVASRIAANQATAAKEIAQGKMFDSQVASNYWQNQSDFLGSSAAENRANIPLIEKKVEEIDGNLKTIDARISELKARAREADARAREADSASARNAATAEAENARTDLHRLSGIRENNQAQKLYAEKQLLDLGYNKAKYESDYYGSGFGRFIEDANRGGSLIEGAIDTFQKGKNLLPRKRKW